MLCEQTREANKRIKMFFGLCLILFGFGNIVADFHVLFPGTRNSRIDSSPLSCPRFYS